MRNFECILSEIKGQGQKNSRGGAWGVAYFLKL